MKTLLIATLFFTTSVNAQLSQNQKKEVNTMLAPLKADIVWLKAQKKVDSIAIRNLQSSNANLVNQNNQLTQTVVFNKAWSDSLYRSIGTIYLDTTRSTSFRRHIDTIYIKTK